MYVTKIPDGIQLTAYDTDFKSVIEATDKITHCYRNALKEVWQIKYNLLLIATFSIRYDENSILKTIDMTSVSNEQSAIIRTERGLTISGTRITLYDIIDYLKAQYPPKFIRDIFNLTDEQINTVLSYIKIHQTEVEAEYQEVVQTSEEIRQYWEKRNREHFTRMAAELPKPEYIAVRAKLQEQRAKREAKN